MRYSQTTELAIHSLLYMAAHRERRPFSVEEVAEAQSVSPTYLAKVFQSLAKAALLRSNRGAKGGYDLGKEPSDISLLDIANIFEGSSPLYICRKDEKGCEAGPQCLVHHKFQEAERLMNETLGSVTLEQILNGMEPVRDKARWLNKISTTPRTTSRKERSS